MVRPRIREVRAYVVRGGGADYHDRGKDHWIDDHIATPMAKYSKYRSSRQAFGVNVLGSVVVEVEAYDGTIGVGVSTGGDPAAWIIENHLSRFVEESNPADIERMWDQMFLATTHYGRRGLVLNAISAVDLALWDLLGKLVDEPVYSLLGGAVRDEILFYATGPRPDIAQEFGFIGGKLPLHHGPAEGNAGLRANIDEFTKARTAVGDDFWLMLDCWMALDVDYATRLARAVDDLELRWLEEALPPEDYWGYGDLRNRLPASILMASGEHEATRWGFRLLIELGKCDILQPDIGWCGGMTELVKISSLADAHSKWVIPHGSSVYSYHFVVTRHNSPFAEFLMMHPDATEVVPMFSPLLINEPVPVNGRLRLTALDAPGFGVQVNRAAGLSRPYSH